MKNKHKYYLVIYSTGVTQLDIEQFAQERKAKAYIIGKVKLINKEKQND